MSKKITIVYILEATSGGTRRHITQILTHIDLGKFEPILYCGVKRDPAFQKDLEIFQERGIKVLTFPMKRAIAPVSDFYSLLTMTGALKRDQPDIVHTHSSKAGIIGRIAAKQAKIPKIVHTPHVFPFEMAASPLKRRFYLFWERYTAKFTNLLIAVSKAEKAVAVENRLFSKGQVVVNPNGINPAIWPQNEIKRKKRRQKSSISGDSFVVGMVGRFMPQKGYFVLLDAAREVLKTHQEVKFFLVGNGELKKTIQIATVDRKIDKHFYFLDETDNIASIYALFDCLVLPSLWEGCPYVLLEAMGMGVPVIASSVGGIPEILKNDSGILVPPADAEKLAKGIKKLCENRKVAKKMGQKGRKQVLKKFLLKDSIKKLEKIYGKLLKK